MDDAICFDGVSFRYGDREALTDVALRVPRGTLYGLVGPNGAGKTTLLHLATTLATPARGRVTVCGFDSVRQAIEVRRRIGFAPEEPLLYRGLTARELVELSATLHGAAAAVAVARAAELLDELGLAARGDDVLAGFSKGMQRKALIAAALAHDPELLILDEPLEGLDVFAQRTLKALLQRRVAAGKTVLYSSHILEVIEGWCSHVAIVAAGRIRVAGELASVHASLGVRTLAEAFATDGAAAKVSDG